MATNELSGLRAMGQAVATEGCWMVVVNGSVKMFGLTKERAEEYAEYYQGGKAVQM